MANETAARRAPIVLTPSRSYPGFQLYLNVIGKGTADKLVRDLALTVARWLDQRLSPENGEGKTAPVEAERAFVSHKGEYGSYPLTVIYSAETNEWAMSLREPDAAQDEREPVHGRSFVTEVAIRADGDKSAEFGCRITVSDPDGAPEVNNAYRPVFVREMFEAAEKGTYTLRQAGADLFGQLPWTVETKKDAERLVELIGNGDEDNQLPILLFTLPEEKAKDVGAIIQAVQAEGWKPSPFGVMVTPPAQPDGLEKDRAAVAEAAVDCARHNFGFCRTALLLSRAEEFLKTVRADGEPGDLFRFDPPTFGGERRRISGQTVLRDSFSEKIKTEIRAFGKHKPYCWGGLRFVRELEIAQEKRRIEEGVKDARLSAEELGARLREETQKNAELLERLDEANKALDQATGEKAAEYERARKEFSGKIDALERKNETLENENRDLTETVRRRDEQIEAQKGKREPIPDGVTLRPAEVKEFFPDEQYDLVVNILQQAQTTYGGEGNERIRELLDALVENNPIRGEGLRWLDEIERVFLGNRKFTSADLSTLRGLGFETPDEKAGDGHVFLSLQGRKRYRFKVSSTPDEYRTRQNEFNKTVKKSVSIYKNPKIK